MILSAMISLRLEFTSSDVKLACAPPPRQSPRRNFGRKKAGYINQLKLLAHIAERDGNITTLVQTVSKRPWPAHRGRPVSRLRWGDDPFGVTFKQFHATSIVSKGLATLGMRGVFLHFVWASRSRVRSLTEVFNFRFHFFCTCVQS